MPDSKPVPRVVPTLTEVFLPGQPTTVAAVDPEWLAEQVLQAVKPKLEQQLRASLQVLIEQQMREPRGFSQRDCNTDITGRKFFGDDARGQIVRAGAAEVFGQRQTAQSHLRCLIDQLQRQRLAEILQTIRMQNHRLNLALDKIANRVAKLLLFRREVQVVHGRRLKYTVTICF